MVNSKKAVSLGLASMFSLYLLGAFIAEPARTLADAVNTPVSVTLASDIAFSCGDGTAALGTITGNGEANDSVTCTATTQNSSGYNITWRITSGSGNANGYNTGHLNSFTSSGLEPEAKIIPIATDDTTPSDTFTGQANDVAAWGGRVMDASECEDGDANCSTGTTVDGFDADGSAKYLRVATGAAVVIVNRTNETPANGDDAVINFKAKVGNATFLPTTTYKAVVTLTATDNN